MFHTLAAQLRILMRCSGGKLGSDLATRNGAVATAEPTIAQANDLGHVLVALCARGLRVPTRGVDRQELQRTRDVCSVFDQMSSWRRDGRCKMQGIPDD